MPNKSRLINNVIGYNSECAKVFSSIARTHKTTPTELPATTPIPNQVFATEQNRFGKPATIHFTKNANNYLQYLRDLDHYIASINMSNGKQCQPLKFGCFGYRDLDGDIVITSVKCPVYEEAYEQGFTKQSQVIEFIMKNMSSKDMSIENTATVFDYLRHSQFTSENPLGTDIVALLGTTKHASLDNDTYNCFSVSELSEAVMPYYVSVKSDNIVSGTLAITPKTISEKYLVSRGKKDNIGEYLQDGSLEVALISYEKSPTSGYVTPVNITNVTQALAQTDKGLQPIKISMSSQPTERLYKAQVVQDYSM